MSGRSLLAGGLVSGAVAIVALVLGLAFYWSDGWQDRGYGGYGGYGGGMMGGGMMGGTGAYGMGGMMGSGMMGGGGPADVSTAPLTIDQANDAAERYLEYWGNSDLKVREIMEFTNGFYALVGEQSTGVGAFELIVDRNTGTTSPEPGPNMMWNTKYGAWGTYEGSTYGTGGMMGGGMMGGRYGRDRATTTTDMPVSKTQARERTQQFLDRQIPGAKAEEPSTFYGYYTVDVEKDDRPLGMLSIDGYYGQVWYHSWHGSFLSEKKF